MNFAKNIFVLLLICSAFNMCEPSILEESAYHSSTTIDSQQGQQGGNCICYVNDKKLPLVSEILETTNHLLERLVVYFYKDLATGKNTMYIPNYIKQQLIPDLAFEFNDSLTYPSPTETIDNVINMRVHKNILHNVSEDPGSGLPIIFSNAIPTIDYESIANVPNDWYSDIVEVDGQPVNIEIPEDVFHNPIDDKAPIAMQDDTTNYVPSASTKTMNTSNNEMVKNEPKMTDMHTESLINTAGVPYEFIPINNDFVSYNKESQISNKYPESKGNKKWIEQQILSIDGDLNKIDVQSLRLLVLKTLLENKINVTPDGLLKDTFGSLLDPSNLVIRPILVDSSIDYDHLLQNFLEAYMISLKNPPKVLGIIPTGKTYLPHPIKYSKVSNNNLRPRHSSSTSKTNCLNGNCFPETSMEDTPLDSPKLDVRIIPGTLDDNETNITPKRRMNNFLNRSPASKAALNTQHSERNDKEMKNIVDNVEFSQFPSISNTLDTIAKFIIFREQNDDKEVDNKENDLNTVEEGPGIRIVGGSAATGSGTPVSNRGRSGTMHII